MRRRKATVTDMHEIGVMYTGQPERVRIPPRLTGRTQYGERYAVKGKLTEDQKSLLRSFQNVSVSMLHGWNPNDERDAVIIWDTCYPAVVTENREFLEKERKST